jgi:hypothetical protein
VSLAQLFPLIFDFEACLLTEGAVGQVSFGADWFESGRQECADAGHIRGRDLRPYRCAVGYQVAGGGERAAAARAAVAWIYFDCYLPARGHAAAHYYQPSIGAPGLYVIAVAQSAGEARMARIGFGPQGNGRRPWQGCADAEYVNGVRLPAGVLT